MEDHEKTWKELGLEIGRHKQLLELQTNAFERAIVSQRNRPKAMAYFDRSVSFTHCVRVEELLGKKAEGEKILGAFCIYVPEEVALACGVTTVALCGGTQFSIPYAESLLPRDICPLIKSSLGLWLGKMCPYLPLVDLAVGETTCDGKKKTWEILGSMKPMYVMEVPHRKERTDRELWLEEVRAFKGKMEDLSGNVVTFKNLRRAVSIINRKRQALARLNKFRKKAALSISGLDALLVTQLALLDDPQRYILHVEILNKELELRVRNRVRVFPRGSKRIIVAGCPTVAPNWKIHHLVESLGAAIVLDETCTGQRYYADLVDEDAADIDELLQNVADRYMQINCSCFTPNQERVKKLVELTKEYRADGVIQYILQYCHGYNIEAVKLGKCLKEAGIPVLKLETDYSEEDIQPLKIRLEAFLESLE